MQKKPTQPPKRTPPQKVTRPASPPSGQPKQPSRPVTGINRRPAAPPPRQMVTAQERQQLKEQRRSSIGTPLPPNTPARNLSAATASEALQLELDRFNALQPKLMLTQVNDDLEDIDGAIQALPANIENIRDRGYVFKSYLERKVATLTSQWQELRPQVQAAVATQAQQLRIEAGHVQNTLNRRQLATNALSTLETKIGATLRNLEGMYDTLDTNVNQTQQQIDDISWTLQQIEQACFGLSPTEAPVEAVPATWMVGGKDKDGIAGVLYLTDQRVIFEQKEEVATKKVLFFATEKQKVQELMWQIPVGQVAKAVGSKRGFMNKDDYLSLTAAQGASFTDKDGQPVRSADAFARPLETIEIHLNGETGEDWQAFIGRVRSGEIDKERTTPVEPEAIEAVSNAPTKCSTCGATINQPIQRGQRELTCQYCGSVNRW